MQHIVDTTRYPILSLSGRAGRALVEAVRHDLRTNGCAVLPGFLRPEALREGVAECARSRAGGAVFAKARDHNVYMSTPDQRLPAEHPAHVLQRREQGYIAFDQLELTSIFRQLYESEALTNFVCEATERQLHRSADPIACAPISVMEPGTSFPWHFDENDVTLTLMLQPASSGGSFEFCPNLRSADDENAAAVRAVLDGDRRGVVESPLGAGDLQLFHGQNSLHRVSAVGEGSPPRYLFAPAWNDAPGLVNTVERSITSYGRALEVHRNRAAAGRDGLRG